MYMRINRFLIKQNATSVWNYNMKSYKGDTSRQHAARTWCTICPVHKHYKQYTVEANVPCNCDLRCIRMPFYGAESLGQTLKQNSPLCFTPHHNSSNTQWYISYAPVHTTLLDMLCVLNLRQILNAWILAINLKRKRTRSHTRYHPFLAIARNHTDKATKRTLPLSLPHG